MKIDRVQTVFIVIGYFVGFEKNGIDVFYNRKYQKWLAENSTDAEYLNSENSFEFDEYGFIANITFTPFENGIPLTESVYIEEQKKYLDGILKLTDITKSEKRKIEYFINYLKDKKENLKVGAVPQQPKAVIPDNNFNFKNNFDRVSESKVYNFFKTELVNKKYLTIENLHSFLLMAFQDEKIPNTKFSIEKKFLIQDIRNIFYKYFSEVNTVKYNTQDKYVKLLTDYFDGFEYTKIKNNFNR